MDFESLARKNDIESLGLKYAYGRAIMEQTKKETSYPCKSISVIIPSRLERTPLGKLWLEDAIQSIMNQSIRTNIDIEIIVGVDVSSNINDIPKLPVRIVKSVGNSQAQALNAALSVSQGEVITFLEDDDLWHPKKLDEGMIALTNFDFISSNQLEFVIDYNGLRIFQKINDYATPSGWMMRRNLFENIGGFDEHFKYHLDSEWLGRLNQSSAKRCHMVEMSCPARSFESSVNNRHKLANILYQSPLGSCIWNTSEDHPLVYRAVHLKSGMGQIASDPEIRKISDAEHKLIHDKNKNNPW